jgi:hypothetical protein
MISRRCVRRFKQGLCETKIVTCTELHTPGRAQPVRILASKDDVIAAVKQESWGNSCHIAWEFDVFWQTYLELLVEDHLYLYHYTRSAHLFPNGCFLRTQFCKLLRHQRPKTNSFAQCPVRKGSVFDAWGCAWRSQQSRGLSLFRPRTWVLSLALYLLRQRPAVRR